MTVDEFVACARFLMGERTDVAFRARRGPRTLDRRSDCTVIRVDLASDHCESDMREGLERA